MTHILSRLLYGTGLIIVAILAIYYSPWAPFRPFLAFGLAAIVGVVMWEFYRLSIAKGYDPLDKIGILTGGAYTLSLFLIEQAPWLPFLIISLSLAWGFAYFMAKGKDPLTNLSVTYFGLLYCAFPLGFIVLIDQAHNDARLWLLYVIAVTKLTDVGAFFGGWILGKHPLAPLISPKKTIEGAIAGLIVATIASVLLGRLLPMTLIHSLVLGLAIGILAHFGDATESLLKRDAKIKDSNGIPGLGGLLDIVDSLVFTLPLVYIFSQIVES